MSINKAPWWFWVIAAITGFFSVVVLPLCDDCRFKISDIIAGKPPVLGPEKTASKPETPIEEPKKVEPTKSEPPKTETRNVEAPKTTDAAPPVLDKPTTYTAKPPGPWGVSKTLPYGLKYRNANAALKALRTHNIWVSAWAEIAIKELTSRDIPALSVIDFVHVKVSDLKLSGQVPLNAIIKRALERGLALVPIDAIPAIVVDEEDERNLFFATDIMTLESQWKGVLVYGTVENVTGLQVIKWDGFWDSPRTFSSAATFIFQVKN